MSSGGDVKIYSLKKLESAPQEILNADVSSKVNSIRFDKNAAYLFVSSNKGVHALNMKDLTKVVYAVCPSEKGVTDVSVSLDGKIMCLGSDDGKLYLYRRD